MILSHPIDCKHQWSIHTFVLSKRMAIQCDNCMQYITMSDDELSRIVDAVENIGIDRIKDTIDVRSNIVFLEELTPIT